MYNDIISVKNICEAWGEFISDKKKRKDVAEFALNLSRNIAHLREDLDNRTYTHGKYEAFAISDPKPRSIHKAAVRDRLLHHAMYRVMYPHFDKRFVYDSYSCRYMKGTHRALYRYTQFVRKVSQNNSRACWILKCDVRKFFASIDHATLIRIVRKHIADDDVVWLIQRVVESFESTGRGKGLPLGNLTSQLLVNVYMNEFDQYIKHILKQKYYIRYADDFVIMHENKEVLEKLRVQVGTFLNKRLLLDLHPDKVFLKTATSGIDFLGWVHFYHHRVLRSTTKRRMLKNIMLVDRKVARLHSYLGLLKHGNGHALRKRILSQFSQPIAKPISISP